MIAWLDEVWRRLQVGMLAAAAPVLTRAAPPGALARAFGSGRSRDADAKLRYAERLFRLRGWRRWTNCYARSLLRYRYLGHNGQAARLHFGLRRGPRGWTGHAWVTVGAELYADSDAHAAAFTELLAFPR